MSRIRTMLIEEAAYYDAPMNDVKLNQFARALEGIGEQALRVAIDHFRAQPGRSRMPMPGDYLSAIPDGRPGVNEAWAMIPRDEYRSVVWTDEMRIAYGAAMSVIETETQNAFFTFREQYERLVAEARQKRILPKWSLSPGHDPAGRLSALIEAVGKKRITLERAVEINPELEWHPQYERLAIAHGSPVPQISHSGISKLEELKQLIETKKPFDLEGKKNE